MTSHRLLTRSIRHGDVQSQCYFPAWRRTLTVSHTNHRPSGWRTPSVASRTRHHDHRGDQSMAGRRTAAWGCQRPVTAVRSCCQRDGRGQLRSPCPGGEWPCGCGSTPVGHTDKVSTQIAPQDGTQSCCEYFVGRVGILPNNFVVASAPEETNYYY